jgi:predicted GIY-YIG superfamily endonuclease
MVYLLHFSQPLGNTANPHGYAQHYIGYCKDGELDRRLAVHRSGNGARIMAAVRAAGIGYTVAVVWGERGRDYERWLKRQKHASRFCPICKMALADAAGGERA